MSRLATIAAVVLMASARASALVGGAPAAGGELAQSRVMLTSQGGFCSGIALAPTAALTAAHCVLPGSAYS